MNIMDLLVIGLLLLYFLNGMYRGFLHSLLNLGGFFLSWVGAFIGYPLLAKRFMASEFITSFQFYIEGAEKVNDYEAARKIVSTLSKADISAIMDNAKLPSFFSRAIESNLKKQVFSDMGLTTVGEYFNMSIFCLIMNIVAFILVFLLLKCLFTLLTNAYSSSVDLPQLKRFEYTCGGGVTLLRGFFTMHIVFMLVPVAIALMPSQIADMLNSSVASSIFYSGSILLPFIPGSI